MFVSFLILVREVFEIALIIGILLAYLNKSKKSHYKKYIWSGLATGTILSILMGLFIRFGLIQFSHTHEELFEGIAMIIGGTLILTFIYWLYTQKKAFENIKEKLSHHGNNIKIFNIFALTTVAVLREGFEIVLFFIATRVNATMSSLVGGLLGIVLAIAAGYGVYRGGMKLPIKRFFQLTNILLILIAIYLLFSGVHEIFEVLE